MDTTANVGKRAQELRLSFGRTQAELAADAGVSKSSPDNMMLQRRQSLRYDDTLNAAYHSAIQLDDGRHENLFAPPSSNRSVPVIRRTGYLALELLQKHPQGDSHFLDAKDHRRPHENQRADHELAEQKPHAR
jgi:transcriptional regulator with XRE-family HTH domain